MKRSNVKRRLGRAVTISVVCLGIAGLTGLSCSSKKEDKSEADSGKKIAATDTTTKTALQREVREIKYKPTKVPFDLNGKPVTVAGALFVPASQWRDLGGEGEMVAHYTYGPLASDSEQAELTVYFLKEKKYDWEGLVDRWVRQISLPGGRDVRSSARIHSRQVGGMTAHVLSLDGKYTPPMEGFDGTGGVVREYFRLVGVVVEAPEGDIILKLTGPEYTGRVMIEQFMNMIYKIRKA